MDKVKVTPKYTQPKIYFLVHRKYWQLDISRTWFPETWKHTIDFWHDSPTFSAVLYGIDYKIHLYLLRLGPISIGFNWRKKEPKF